MILMMSQWLVCHVSTSLHPVIQWINPPNDDDTMADERPTERDLHRYLQRETYLEIYRERPTYNTYRERDTHRERET